MLKWAREAAGLSIEDVARATKFHGATLQEWEQGVRLPTYAQLEQLAARYKRPMMVFFLESPPRAFSVVKDYRTITAADDMKFSPDCMFAIRRIQERQVWASSYLSDEGKEPIDFVGKHKLSDSPQKVGESIRKLIGIGITDQMRCTSPYESFRMWRDACETLGVLVFTFPRIAVDEMRGFAVSDPFAPVAAVNAKDNYQARTFSLLHEFVHLLLGDSGVSTRTREAVAEHKIERFCETTAAEALMPIADFKRRVPDRVINIDQLLDNLSTVYWCSRSAILYRLADSGHLTLSEAYERARRFVVKEQDKETAPIPQATLAVGRNGRYFSQVAVAAYHGGDIHGGQLSALLGLTIKHLPKLETYLSPSQLHIAIGQEQ
jgi:Zn-dependent peptidase ImmA (M78 family)/transcriptional regulator with XRE-family HTH domain